MTAPALSAGVRTERNFTMSSMEQMVETSSECVGWVRTRWAGLARRFGNDDGAGLVEYALLTALIALVCISALVYFQQQVTNKLSTASTSVVNAGS